MAAREVDEFDTDLAGLVERMTLLMRDANGVGLAATQVGVLRSVFVFHESEEQTTVVVNPRVTETSEGAVTADEGCLSLQGVLVPVERPASITIEGNDPSGGRIQLELAELPARVAQHELDHLNGVLIIDRTTPESRREALARLRPRPALGASR